MSGILYIVGTPIGNLSDITLRAIETLKSADAVACEDTRVSAKLLNHLEVKKELISLHEHSSTAKIDKVIGLLKNGKTICYISDAGTPGISDPGGKLVSLARAEGVKIEVIPGPSALAAAVSVCGFVMSEFIFMGFLPHKKGRQTKLKNISLETRPVVLYESPYRIKKLLSELNEFVPEREVFVGRELTKKFEEHYVGLPSQLVNEVKDKGEHVVIISGQK
jgi:16S rRNA (cytidine1402-2'-O)-methyltransferase